MNRATELSIAFLEDHPAGAAHVLDQVPTVDAAAFVEEAPEDAVAVVLGYMQPARSLVLLTHLKPSKAAALLSRLAPNMRSVLLRALPNERMVEILATLSKRQAATMRRYLAYGTGTVGAWMNAPKAVFSIDASVEDCLKGLRGLGTRLGSVVFAVNEERKLLGTIEVDRLLSANDGVLLKEIVDRRYVSLSPQALLTSVVTLRAWDKTLTLPVVDRARRLVGVLHFDHLREGLVVDRSPAHAAQVNVMISHLMEAFLISLSGLLQTATVKPIPTRLAEDGEN